MIGHDIVVTILSIGRDQVRIGIRAPADVEVHREEVYRAIQQANREAATSGTEGLGALADVLGSRGQAGDTEATNPPQPPRSDPSPTG